MSFRSEQGACHIKRKVKRAKDKVNWRARQSEQREQNQNFTLFGVIIM